MSKTKAHDGTVVETEERPDGSLEIRITPPGEVLQKAIRRDEERQRLMFKRCGWLKGYSVFDL
jgi:hypothetical protein